MGRQPELERIEIDVRQERTPTGVGLVRGRLVGVVVVVEAPP